MVICFVKGDAAQLKGAAQISAGNQLALYHPFIVCMRELGILPLTVRRPSLQGRHCQFIIATFSARTVALRKSSAPKSKLIFVTLIFYSELVYNERTLAHWFK